MFCSLLNKKTDANKNIYLDIEEIIVTNTEGKCYTLYNII